MVWHFRHVFFVILDVWNKCVCEAVCLVLRLALALSRSSLSWVALSFSSLSQNLLNFLLKKGVLSSYCAYSRESEILSDQCSWAKSVLRDCCLLWRILFSLSPVNILLVLLEMARRCSFFNQGPMSTVTF